MKNSRCKYCHTVHDLDSKGRCPSCADAGDATNVYGLHYGDFIAQKRSGTLAAPQKGKRQKQLEAALLDFEDIPRCRICGSVLPPRRRALCSVACEKEDKLRRNRSAAHGKGGPRLCPICGKKVGPDLRKTYCSWECFHQNEMQREARYREKKRSEKKGNVE